MKFIIFALFFLVGTFNLGNTLRMTGRMGAAASSEVMGRHSKMAQTAHRARHTQYAPIIDSPDEDYEERKDTLRAGYWKFEEYPEEVRLADRPSLVEEEEAEGEESNTASPKHYWGLTKQSTRPSIWPEARTNATYWGLRKAATRPISWPAYRLSEEESDQEQ